MSRYIIGIHGLRNKPPAKLLEQWWQLAIREGLERIERPSRKIPFDLVYWADEMYPEALDPSQNDPDHEYYLSEPYHWGVSAKTEDEPGKINKLRRYLEKQLHQIFLNPDLSLNYEEITDRFLRHFFKDLDTYFATPSSEESANESTRHKIQQKVLDVLDKHADDQILLIAHSMGSIIAYDVMTSYPARCSNIEMLITIGSPLGLPVIQGKLAFGIPAVERAGDHLKTPSILKGRWINYYDPEDTVAFDQLLSDDYGPNDSGIQPEDIAIVNDYIDGKVLNPHKSYGYLRTPVLAKNIEEFLSPQMGSIKRLSDRVWYWLAYPLKQLRKRWER
jgi:hypothetical protein